jgi:hypothetical protein
VKPFVKRQKNDAADAEAIAEAASRPTMRFVAVKSEEQQARAMLFRTRDLLVRQRTQLINAVRGHLAEHGVVAAQVGAARATRQRGAACASRGPAGDGVSLVNSSSNRSTCSTRGSANSTRSCARSPGRPRTTRRLQTMPGWTDHGGRRRDVRAGDGESSRSRPAAG